MFQLFISEYLLPDSLFTFSQCIWLTESTKIKIDVQSCSLVNSVHGLDKFSIIVHHEFLWLHWYILKRNFFIIFTESFYITSINLDDLWYSVILHALMYLLFPDLLIIFKVMHLLLKLLKEHHWDSHVSLVVAWASVGFCMWILHLLSQYVCNIYLHQIFMFICVYVYTCSNFFPSG